MVRILVVTSDNETKSALRKSLAEYNLACSFSSHNNGIREAIVNTKPDVLLYEVRENQSDVEISEAVRRLKKRENLRVIALVPEKMLDRVKPDLDADDFILSPANIKELNLSIKRLLRKNADEASSEQIKFDGLTIDLATCEVTVNGRIVELTFKEYELLKLLAGNPGRVYTRAVLLDNIWGYDYFGGDRTVDVHIRRLRSKIEDASHTYIETVRNIGYRFTKNS
jgi:two-component system alkaline phosphatase synthesis response regulator PhoP